MGLGSDDFARLFWASSVYSSFAVSQFRVPRCRFSWWLFHVWDGGVVHHLLSFHAKPRSCFISYYQHLFENRSLMALLVYPSTVRTLRTITFLFVFYALQQGGWLDFACVV
jgi:hypothetical protein